MNFENMYNQLYPDFFAPGKLDFMKDDVIYEELIMSKTETDYKNVSIKVSDSITFRFADTSNEKEMKTILQAVKIVDESWPPYFNTNFPIYCAFDGEKIASFCLIDHMGTCQIDGKQLKVGGPGCVGTVPEYRKKGIGLKMVQNATELTFKKSYDLSWIHWTGVAAWYEKLGYKKILKWNKKGFLKE